jgi:putative MATE family efflux protein
MSKAFGKDLTTGSIPRLMIAFSLPMLIGSFLMTAYSLINAIWVGQYLGPMALAAVTVSFPVIFIVFGIGMGMTMATSVLVAQSFGAKRMDDLRQVVDSSTLLIGGLGVVMALLGELFAPAILRAMGTDPTVFQEASAYLRVTILCIPLNFGFFLMRGLMQGTGQSRVPLVFQAISVILTAVLDPLLMLGWGGFPKMGLVGTAWASLIAQSLVIIGLIAYLRWQDAPVAPRWPRLRHLGPITLKTLRIGVPASLQQCVVSFGMVFVTGLVNHFGPTATAAFGAAARIDQIAFMPAMTLAMAISTLAGQNIGAGKHDRVRTVFYWGCLFNGGITLLVSALAVSQPLLLLRMFGADAEVLGLGASYLRIVGAAYVFVALSLAGNGIINGSGRTIVTTITSLVSMWAIRVPLGYWLSGRMGSVEGVWWAIAISSVASMLLSWGYYFSGAWQKPLGARLRPDLKPQT